MNPEMDASMPELTVAQSPTRAASLSTPSPSIRKSHVFQRRLKEKISESRALELLDRRIKTDRVSTASATGDSNQEQDEELVCDSTMVRFEATPEETTPEPRACGVLKTVRGIHRQRERDHQSSPTLETIRENQ